MKPHTPSILDTFGEALDVFVMVLKQTWLKVLPVFLLTEGVHALYRRHAMKGGVMPLDSFRTDNNVSTLLGVTVGLFAVVTVVRAAYMHCCKAYGDEEPQGGRVEAWGRLLGTTWLIGIIVVGIVIAGLIVMLGFGLGMRSPLAAVGSLPTSALAFLLMVFPLFAAIGVIVCLSVRWSFAPILSVVTSRAGTSALSESNAWVKGRFGRVFLFLGGVYLICAGMGFPFNFPCACALSGPSLGFPQLASPSAWWWTCALSLVSDFAMLYLPVALLVFWLLLQSGPEAEVEPGRHRGIVLVLLTLGFAGWIFGLACGVKVGMLARNESRTARQAQIDALNKAVEEMRGMSEASSISDSDKALVKGFAADHATIDGDELVSEFAHDGRWKNGILSELQRELKGRPFVLARARVNSVDDSVTPMKVVVTPDSPNQDPQHDTSFAFTCSISQSALAADFVPGDILTNLTARIGETDRAPWPSANGMRPLRLTHASFGFAGEVSPLPEFDAKTITGDELFALLAKRKTALSVSQLDELQTALAGRRLTFAFGRARIHGMTGLDDDRLLSVHFPLADDRLSNAFVGEFALGGRMSANSTGDFFMEISTIGKSITGTVAKPGSGIKSSGKLFFVQAEVEIDKDREVKIMRRE